MFKNFFKKAKAGHSAEKQAPGSADELTLARIGDFDLRIKKSSPLPSWLASFPFYSTNVPRLTRHLKQCGGDLQLIDIGANIGDTVALVRSSVFCPILCIEGDPFYYSLLVENLRQFPEAYPCHRLLGAEQARITADLHAYEVSMRIRTDAAINAAQLSLTTLDVLLQQQPQFRRAKLLKIDTDGFDFKIIRGGLDYIRETAPVIFLEYQPVFFSNGPDEGLQGLELLASMGYEQILFYDNFGCFLLAATLAQKELLASLDHYVNRSSSPIPYFDMCLFHKKDQHLAQGFLESEKEFFSIQKK